MPKKKNIAEVTAAELFDVLDRFAGWEDLSEKDEDRIRVVIKRMQLFNEAITSAEQVASKLSRASDVIDRFKCVFKSKKQLNAFIDKLDKMLY